MTKREICKRLLLMHARAVRNRDASEICDLICSLLTDIAAPEEKELHNAQCVKRNPVSPFDRLIPAGEMFAVYRCPICAEFSAKPTASGKLYCKKCNEEIDPACFHRPPVTAPKEEGK